MRSFLSILCFALGVFCGQLVWNHFEQKHYDEKVDQLTLETMNLATHTSELARAHLDLTNSGQTMADYFISNCPDRQDYLTWYHTCRRTLEQDLYEKPNSASNNIKADVENINKLLKWLNPKCKKYGKEADKQLFNHCEIEVAKANELLKETDRIRYNESEMFIKLTEPYILERGSMEKMKAEDRLIKSKSLE